MTEIECPRMIVCFEKQTYDLVKDICIDNGAQSVGKMSSLKDKMDVAKMDAAYREGEWTDSNDVTPGFDNFNTILLNEPSMSDAHNGVSKQQPHRFENHKETEIVRKPASLSNWTTSDHPGDKPCFSTLDPTTDGQPRLYHGNDPALQYSDDVNHQDSSKWDSANEANTQESSARSDDELGSNDNSSDIGKSRAAILSEVDGGNMKRLINEAPDTEYQTERNLDPLQHAYPRDANRETTDGLTAEARSSLVHYGFADASLFGQHSLPNSISFSGQTAYIGSTSLRSDSSTASASSFAFPVLQSEWNSSPVKMAKADRKHYRRQRWRNGFLCCRF